MSITVRCWCGARFRAKDEFAGRTLKCPNCHEPLVVPARGPRRGGARRPGRARRRESRSSSVPLTVGAIAVCVLLIGGALWLTRGRSGERRVAIDRPSPPKAAQRSRAPAPPPPALSYSDADVARLAKQLQAATIRARAAAARGLARIGPQASQAVPALLHARTRGSEGIEARAAIDKALKAIGPAAVPHLVAALKSGGETVRFHAAQALGTLGPKAEAAVPDLAAALESDGHRGVRASAARALGAIGRPALRALAALRRVAGNPNTPFSGDAEKDQLRAAAQAAINRIRTVE